MAITYCCVLAATMGRARLHNQLRKKLSSTTTAGTRDVFLILEHDEVRFKRRPRQSAASGSQTETHFELPTK